MPIDVVRASERLRDRYTTLSCYVSSWDTSTIRQKNNLSPGKDLITLLTVKYALKLMNCLFLKIFI